MVKSRRSVEKYSLQNDNLVFYKRALRSEVCLTIMSLISNMSENLTDVQFPSDNIFQGSFFGKGKCSLFDPVLNNISLHFIGKTIILIYILWYAFLNHSILGWFLKMNKQTLIFEIYVDCLGIVTQFMYSKPPGRRMVTSDIHNYFVISFHHLNFSYYFSFLARVVFGHLPFWVIFVLVEFMKQGLFVSLAVFNISTLIQTSFILNHNWVHIYEDKV